MNVRVTVNNSPLSAKEIECVMWMADGKTIDDMAQIMGLSRNTIMRRVENAKLAAMAANAPALVAKALRMGWIA